MATGAAPAPERPATPETKVDAQTATTETPNPQPLTLKQRIQHLFREIFEGREDHLGWHQ
jgi:hypothetical protein